MRKSMFCLFLAGALYISPAGENDEANIAQDESYTTITIKKFTFSYKTIEDNLAEKVSCPTKGWIAVGFNPIHKMKGGNFIVGYADGEKEIVWDEYGNSPYSHEADTLSGGKNDLLEYSCIEKGETTTLAFTIPLNSGDKRDVVLEKGKKITVILAAGKKDNLKKKHYTIAKTKVVF